MVELTQQHLNSKFRFDGEEYIAQTIKNKDRESFVFATPVDDEINYDEAGIRIEGEDLEDIEWLDE